MSVWCCCCSLLDDHISIGIMGTISAFMYSFFVFCVVSLFMLVYSSLLEYHKCSHRFLSRLPFFHLGLSVRLLFLLYRKAAEMAHIQPNPPHSPCWSNITGLCHLYHQLLSIQLAMLRSIRIPAPFLLHPRLLALLPNRFHLHNQKKAPSPGSVNAGSPSNAGPTSSASIVSRASLSRFVF